MDKNTRISDLTVQYLLEINEGQCSINFDLINDEEDENLRLILTGLLYLHEDNALIKEELEQKEKEQKEFEEFLILQRQELQLKTKYLEDSKKELIAINKELEHFAYVVSHDLKAPLIGIRTLADFISEDIADSNFENLDTNINTLQGRVDHMHNLITGILEYSKIGRRDMRIEEIDLNELAADVIDLINPPENFKVTINTKLPKIKGVRVHMEQVFANFISNGIKYNDKSTGTVEIEHKREEKGHLFSFKDNGMGIEKQYYDKIFDVFQTLNAWGTVDSTGVGLSIVKKIIDNLKGSIEVKSVPNEGTEFLVRIPEKFDN